MNNIETKIIEFLIEYIIDNPPSRDIIKEVLYENIQRRKFKQF